MTEPLRDQVLEGILTALTAIPEDSARHTQGHLRTTRDFKPWIEWNEFPVLTVVEGPGSLLRQVTTGQEYQHAFVVTVWGYVRHDDVVGCSRALQRLWDDVIKVLLGPDVLGGVVSTIEVGNELETDEGQFHPIGVFAQDFLTMFTEAIPGG